MTCPTFHSLIGWLNAHSLEHTGHIRDLSSTSIPRSARECRRAGYASTGRPLLRLVERLRRRRCRHSRDLRDVPFPDRLENAAASRLRPYP